MKANAQVAKGFTVLEVMVVVAVIGTLAALLLPALSRAKNQVKRTTCLNNLAHIAKGVHMYADDFSQILFPIVNSSEPFWNPMAFYEWTAYDALMRNYVGLKGAPSPQDRLFACPADTFYFGNTNGNSLFVPQSQHLQSNASFSSYAFNAGNAVFRTKQPFAGMFPGIKGSKLSSIALPAKTVLVEEFPAVDGYSWHQPSLPGKEHYNHAPSNLSFVDGHVRYVKMYSGSNNPSQRFQAPFVFNPPAGYDYKWSAD
jgi:prepilin-type N-terminal cleavage/methylation domain-containing protein/prepilin-type processing-associated H-X9-DG protein